jgi:hypothetical protein
MCCLRLEPLICLFNRGCARARLQELKDTDPQFWAELTSNQLAKYLPPEDEAQLEDEPNDVGDQLDDSDVPISVVVGDIVKDKVPSGYGISSAGGFEAKSAAESIEEEVDVANVEDLGHGKHRKEPN